MTQPNTYRSMVLTRRASIEAWRAWIAEASAVEIEDERLATINVLNFVTQLDRDAAARKAEAHAMERQRAVAVL